MQLSKEDLFSDKQNLGALGANATLASLNVIDTQQHRDDVKRRLTVFAKLDTDVNPATGYVTAKLQTSADNAAWTDILVGSAQGKKAGDYLFDQALPSGVKRYLRVFYVNSATAVQSGLLVTAGFVMGQTDKAFQGRN